MYFITYSVKYDEVIHPSNKIEIKILHFSTCQYSGLKVDLELRMVSFRGKPHNR